MAQLRKHLRHRIRASSIIEVTVAMVILSLVFSLSLVIYLNIQKNSLFNSRLNYYIMMDQVFNRGESRLLQTTVNFGEVTVIMDIQVSADNPMLKTASLEVRDARGKMVAQQRRIFYDPKH